jgi:hypothetical protein
MIQQITPSTRTARKTSAVSAGTPSRTKTAAGSIPAAVRVAGFTALFTAPSFCGAELAA